MLKTVVCDDELPALELMSQLMADTGRVKIAGACQSVEEALAMVNQGGIDLIVMDIEMPGISGVDAYSRITATPKPLLIFATAHPEYAVEAFGVDAIDYLLKPLDPERVRRAVDKAVRLRSFIASSEEGAAEGSERLPSVHAASLTVKDAGHIYVIPYDDVTWIEAAGDYSLIHTPEREYALRTPLRTLEEDLPGDKFIRVHRSAIVSASKVREVRLLTKGEALISLTSGAPIRASRSYRDAVRRLVPDA